VRARHHIILYSSYKNFIFSHKICQFFNIYDFIYIYVCVCVCVCVCVYSLILTWFSLILVRMIISRKRFCFFNLRIFNQAKRFSLVLLSKHTGNFFSSKNPFHQENSAETWIGGCLMEPSRESTTDEARYPNQAAIIFAALPMIREV